MRVIIGYAAAAIVGVLLVIRSFNGDFLAGRIFDPVPLQWYWLVLTASLWAAAYFLTPVLMQGLNKLAKHWFLPATFFVILIVGAAWGIDTLWNHGVCALWGDACPESHFLPSFTTAFLGGR